MTDDKDPIQIEIDRLSDLSVKYRKYSDTFIKLADEQKVVAPLDMPLYVVALQSSVLYDIGVSLLRALKDIRI